jgi:aldose 1-epimerase
LDRIALKSAGLRVEIAPERGGSVTRLDATMRDGARPILRPTGGDKDASQAAMHPLLPFANRVPDNVIDLAEPPLHLLPNVPGERCALHGIGWQRAWRVLEATPESCALELIVEDWVFRFRATQRFSVEDNRFHAEITIENTSDRAIPAGLGFHPYFLRRPGMTLQFRAERFWLEGPGHLPTDAIALPPELDFAEPAPLPESWRNNCYSGWDGVARLRDAESVVVHITAGETLRELMLYTPSGADFFCLEPQSHTSGAVTKARARWPATPLRILAPSEGLAGSMTIEVA